MLKLQYTENGLFMERVIGSIEILVAQRVLLAMRSGQTLHVQPSNASFLVPANSDGLTRLDLALRLDRDLQVTVIPVDTDWVEISVQGTWIAESIDAEEGIFITELGEQTEFWIYKLWEITQAAVSYIV
jgi:hypothetical protein